MSLEEALKENTAALIANTAALEKAAAGREKALEAAAALKSGTTGKAATVETEDEPVRTRKPKAEEPEPKKAAKDEPKKTKPKAITLDVLKSAVGAFLAGPKSDEDLDEAEAQEAADARTDFVVAMLAEFGVGKVSEIEKDDWARAMDYIERKTNGEDVDFAEDAPKKRASLID